MTDRVDPVDRPRHRPVDDRPWLAAPLRQALATQSAHALLLQGPSGVGQFELALALAQAWLCESASVPLPARPCGDCASCRLIRAGSHPDLLVVVPEVLRETLVGAAGEGDAGGDERSGKKKPSKDVRVEDVRLAIAFATTTSSRGRGKVVVVHPAERMNPIAANAFLKTLEEPPGAARFLLCTAAPDALLPTIRSRCQALMLTAPPPADAAAWLRARGVADPDVLLRACSGRPQDALDLAAAGVDAAAWTALPRRVAAGDPGALRGWPLPAVADALQKLCHDAASLAVGAAPRYFPPAALPVGADLAALLRWGQALRRFALHAEHPWIADLGIESLVEQGREALHTPRIGGRAGRVDSLDSVR